MTPVDPVALLRTLLVELAPTTALENVPVRSNGREAGDEPPYVLLAEAGDLRARNAPAYLPARVELSVWGRNDGEAVTLYRLASSLLHGFGPAIRDGAGLWKAFDETGAQKPLTDPDTGWVRAFGVFDLYMADRAIT